MSRPINRDTVKGDFEDIDKKPKMTENEVAEAQKKLDELNEALGLETPLKKVSMFEYEMEA